MRTIFFAAFRGMFDGDAGASAQRRVNFDAKTDYALTVEKQSASDVSAWWPAFVGQHSLEG